MSVLGTQLVFSMVMASVLSKLSAHFSIGSWILTSRLVRYLHPTDDELRGLTGMPATGYSKNKGRKNYKKYAAKDEPFTVPKSLDIQLEAAKVQPIDVMPMKFYSEFQWLVDFAFCALFIYVATEAYYALVQPRNEYNLSMMWAVLVIGFCLKVLYSLTAMYFNKDGDGEWVICVVLGVFFLVFAMVILIVNDEILEFELDAAYRNFSAGAKEMLTKQGIDSEGPASLLTFRIMLAIIAALLGSFLSFPGLRLAKMHLDSLKYARERPFLQLLLYTNMVFPLLLSIMWVRPVIREQLVYTQSNSNSSTYLIKPQTFEAARIIAVIFFCVLRFCLTWTHLQSHLNMACAKMEELKKEAGRISSLELQKRVARVFYYLCVVALQYVVPLILLLYCTIMWKTLGDFSWADAFGIHSVAANSTSSSIKQPPLPVEGEATIAASAAQFSFALRNLQIIFTPVWFRGLFSFLCWWICTAWFTTSAFGLVYYSYFTM